MFKIIRKPKNIIEIWLPPENDPEGEKIATLNADYIPSLLASLKKFEQSEGR